MIEINYNFMDLLNYTLLDKYSIYPDGEFDYVYLYGVYEIKDDHVKIRGYIVNTDIKAVGKMCLYESYELIAAVSDFANYMQLLKARKLNEDQK